MHFSLPCVQLGCELLSSDCGLSRTAFALQLRSTSLIKSCLPLHTTALSNYQALFILTQYPLTSRFIVSFWLFLDQLAWYSGLSQCDSSHCFQPPLLLCSKWAAQTFPGVNGDFPFLCFSINSFL